MALGSFLAVQDGHSGLVTQSDGGDSRLGGTHGPKNRIPPRGGGGAVARGGVVGDHEEYGVRQPQPNLEAPEAKMGARLRKRFGQDPSLWLASRGKRQPRKLAEPKTSVC